MNHKTARFGTIVGIFCLAITSLLIGCSAARPVGHRNNPKAEPIANAGFFLKDINVSWKTNPALRTEFNYVTMNTDDERARKYGTKRAVADFTEILRIMKDNAASAMESALAKAGASYGKTQTLVLMPISAYRDVSGWGTGIVVRATVMDDKNNELWSIDMDVNSGVQWIGADFSKPDASYVVNLVNGLMKVLRQAGMIAESSV